MSTEIQDRHRKQLAVMRGFLEGKGYYVALEALELVRNLELGFRKDQRTPKFHHQLSIVRLLTTLLPHLMYPEETLAVAFLHDLIEDHPEWTRERVAAKFGTFIADAVWTLTKKTGGLTKTPEAYYAAIADCPVASPIKLADRAYNVQTMKGVFTPDKQRAYTGEVAQWYFPMIKTARRKFPRQFGAYENLRILLRCQCSLIEMALEAQAPPGNTTP